MSSTSHNRFDNMTSKEKDEFCDRNYEILQELIARRNEREQVANDNLNQKENNTKNEKSNRIFKRQLTSTSQYGDNDLINEEFNNSFTIVTNNNKRKQQRIDDKETIEANENNDLYIIEDSTPATTVKNGGRLFVNSRKRTNNNDHLYSSTRSADMSHQSYAKEFKNKSNNRSSPVIFDSNNGTKRPLKINENQSDKEHESHKNVQNNEIHISRHALNYAVEQHLPPVHIICEPKVKDYQKGKDLIKELCAYIEKDFRKINKHYNLPLGFEYWFIDKNGDLTCYTKHNELFVYLCEPHHYPTTLLSVDISPSRPKHLPSHHTLVLKFVPNDITLDEINNELNLSIKSIFNLEEMNGSRTNKCRHLRLEVKSSIEYDQLIQKGGVTIDGRLFELQEFLAPPRLLICSKCNEPGHIRRNCTLNYDSCRRCGKDRSVGEHKECQVNCHRCNQDHMSTDYKCPYLIEYRRSLISQLKQKPYLLPPNIQIFIPTEYRERGIRNNKIIINPNSTNNNNNKHINSSEIHNQQQPPFSLNSHTWPSLLNDQLNNNINPTSEQSIWDDLQIKQIEINKLKTDFELKINQCQSKSDENTKKLKEILQIISSQTRCQNENIERCYTTLNEFSSLLSLTFDAFKQFTSNINDQNDNKSQELLLQISNSIKCIQERNKLLITNQKSLNNLIEQQGQLLVQAVNTLSLNNE